MTRCHTTTTCICFQRPGFISDMCKWMIQEAENMKLTEDERAGAIILDELSIQEDLSLINKGVNSHYSGQVKITPHCEALIQERKGT